MLVIFPEVGLIADTLDFPSEAPMVDDFQESSWTDENGIFHHTIREVLSFDSLDGMPEDTTAQAPVIDASGEAAAVSPVSDELPGVLPLNIH